MKRNAMPIGALLGAALAAAGAARAAEAKLVLDADVAYEGEPILLQVRITDPEPGMGAPSLPPVDGLTFRGPGRPSPQSSTSIAGGQRRSEVHLTYPFEVTPVAGRRGKLTIGPCRVPRRAGQPLLSNTVELRVCGKPKVGIQAFEAQVSPPQGPVATPFTVVYTIYYGGETGQDDDDPFPSFFGNRRSSFGLTGLDLPLLERQGIKIQGIRVHEDREGSQVGLRTKEGEVPIVIQPGFAERPDGLGYKTLTFGFQVTPLVPGPIEVGGATAVMQLPTGGTTVGRDVFGRPARQREVAEYKATAPSLAYAVRELPAEGRPPGFAGAVGKFTVQARTQKTEVRELDPVDVEVRVAGTGLLEELRPPVWTEMPGLTKDFEISTDVDPGKVEGKEKVFRLTLRPKSDKVQQIPPIPFPYFEPRAFRYEVATSQPLPLKVQAWRTVTEADVVPSARRGPALEPAAGAPAATGTPAILEQVGIGANFEELGEARPALDPRQELLSPGFLATLTVPVALLALLGLGLRLCRRDPRALRRARALAKARAALGSRRSFDELAAALGAYFHERLDLPPGELTPADLDLELARRGVPPEPRSRARALHDRILAGRFGVTGETVAGLGEEALQALREVDACLR